MKVGVTHFDARPVVVIVMAFVGTMPVQADVLFDNFGPGDTFFTGAGYSFGEFGGSTLESGNHFSVTGGDFFLDSIELPVGLSFGQNLLRLDFYSDDAGLPGGVLETVVLEDQMGPTFMPDPPIAAIFSGTTVLEEGLTYWVVASGGAETNAIWFHNNIGDMGINVFRNNMGDWIVNGGGPITRSAFRVNGTPVPAPGTLVLLGLAGLMGTRRRRR